MAVMETGAMEMLGHRPGLDQLRGVAVAIVVTAHGLAGTPVHQAGSVGVVLFFVLSGFLITPPARRGRRAAV